jgi:hypothetical protein
MTNAERVGKVRRGIAEIFEFFDTMIEQHGKTNPQPQEEQSKVGGPGIVARREYFFKHGIFL